MRIHIPLFWLWDIMNDILRFALQYEAYSGKNICIDFFYISLVPFIYHLKTGVYRSGKRISGNLASVLCIRTEGYTTYEYDADGRLVRKSSYYGGEIADEETYFWECENDSGEFQTIYLQEYEYLTEWGSMERKLVRETFYDKEGEIIKENLYET